MTPSSSPPSSSCASSCSLTSPSSDDLLSELHAASSLDCRKKRKRAATAAQKRSKAAPSSQDITVAKLRLSSALQNCLPLPNPSTMIGGGGQAGRKNMSAPMSYAVFEALFLRSRQDNDNTDPREEPTQEFHTVAELSALLGPASVRREGSGCLSASGRFKLVAEIVAPVKFRYEGSKKEGKVRAEVHWKIVSMKAGCDLQKNQISKAPVSAAIAQINAMASSKSAKAKHQLQAVQTILPST